MSNPRPRVKMLFKNLRFAILFCVKKSLMRMLGGKFKFVFPWKKKNEFLKKSDLVWIFKGEKKNQIFYEVQILYEKCRSGFVLFFFFF